MQEKAHLEMGCLEVVVDLAGGVLVELCGRLYFDDQLLVDDHVQALLIQRYAFVHDDHTHLSRDAVPPRLQLPLQRRDVGLFEVPKPSVSYTSKNAPITE